MTYTYRYCTKISFNKQFYIPGLPASPGLETLRNAHSSVVAELKAIRDQAG